MKRPVLAPAPGEVRPVERLKNVRQQIGRDRLAFIFEHNRSALEIDAQPPGRFRIFDRVGEDVGQGFFHDVRGKVGGKIRVQPNAL